MSDYETRVKKIHRDLGIPDRYRSLPDVPLQIEEVGLIEIGKDLSDRPQKLTEKAASAWFEMRGSAQKEGIELNVVSAFRSVERQTEIVRQKLADGKLLDDILQVSAAPGFSEHHTGRALDLTTPGSEPLEECFEDTEAFAWLVDNAAHYNFSLSYPRNNGKFIYEPWHWAFNG